MMSLLKNKKLFAILLLIVIGLSIYAFNFTNTLFWDDNDWIRGNIFVHDFSHVKEIFSENILAGFGLNSNYYRPLLSLSFAFNYVIGGENSIGYHIVSNGFHIGNAILLFLILSIVLVTKAGTVPALQGRLQSRDSPCFNWAAFLAAVIFLVHPVQTEAVTYISGRGDPMSVFFMLLALWLFIQYHQKVTTPNSTAKLTTGHASQVVINKDRHKIWFFWGSLAAAVLAILSRETAVLFPLLLMVFYISFLYKGTFIKSIGQSFKKALPYFGISVVYGILRLTVLNFENTLNFYAQANAYTENLSYRLFTFGHALVEYTKILFAPVGLHMERDLPLATSLFKWPVWLAFLGIVGLIVLLVVLYKR